MYLLRVVHINRWLGGVLHEMLPVDGGADGPGTVWRLSRCGGPHLIYAVVGGELNVDLSADAGAFKVQWINPRTGATMRGDLVGAAAETVLHALTEEAWFVLLER